MFALILDSYKIIMMFALIGTTIVLSHFGQLPAKVRGSARRQRAIASRRSSPS